MATTVTDRLTGTPVADTTDRVMGTPAVYATSQLPHALLLSGDMTDGDDNLLLSGDMTDGDDILLLSGDALVLVTANHTDRVTGI